MTMITQDEQGRARPDDQAADTAPLHPAVADLLKFFEWHTVDENTNEAIDAVRGMYAALARWSAHTLPSGPEQTTALRKLLEAKDCAVRAVIPRRAGD